MSEKEPIPQEWVEVVAKASYERIQRRSIGAPESRPVPWEECNDRRRKPWLEDAIQILSAAIPLIRADERDACAEAIEQKAREIGRQECCGRGMPSACNNYEECCGSPDLMLTDAEAASAIRSRTEAEPLPPPPSEDKA